MVTVGDSVFKIYALVEGKKGPACGGLSDRALEVGEALGQFVALFDLVIRAA
jgi:hypothetical protein